MMPRSEGQALPSRLVLWVFDGTARIGDPSTIPGADGMSETQETRPACGPRFYDPLRIYNRAVSAKRKEGPGWVSGFTRIR